MERKLTTIVSMDVVGFSRMMERDEEGTLDHLKAIRSAIIEPAIGKYAGRTVKLMGDGILAEFSSVVGALQSSVDIVRGLAARNGAAGDTPEFNMRIGMHVGDIIVEGDDIYGDGVNVAARLETLAPPGGIVLSKQVHDHVAGKLSVGFVALGEQTVKNLSRPIVAYRVEPDSPLDEHRLRFGRFDIDTALYELREDGQQVAIEPQVFDLLVYLARNAGRTVTKEEIFAEIWSNRIVSDSALSSQIKAVRKAIGDDGATQHTIRTVHGRGFRFVATLEGGLTAAVEDKPQPDQPTGAEIAALKPSVALLPFENLNRNPDEDYFADGISEDLTTALAKNRWLSVIARNPSFSFRNSSEGIRTIGEKLAADYLVTGSVRKAGNRARITAQLVDTETEHSVWSERFDRDIADIFDLQDEITELVAGRIEAELGLSERRKAARKPRKNRGAWDLYQLGVCEFYKFTPESNVNAQELLRQAIALDPDFASAHSRLAYVMVLNMVYFDALPETERMDEALTAARRAIELDDQDANSHFTLGRVHLARREYDQAIEALEYAVELNPCLAVTYCGLGDSLAYEGRLDEAIKQFEMAIRLSPHDPFRWAFYSYRAMAHLFRGEYAEAVSWARRSVQIPNAQYWARAHLVAALGHLGDVAEARKAVDELRKVKPEFSIDFAREHLFYLKRDDQMNAYVEGLRKAGLT